jgi:hypothetical protein
MLGYLVALDPKPFCRIFGFRGNPRSVSLETRHDSDRSDILVDTTEGLGIIEAKVTGTDPFRQSLKYPAKWRALLTEHFPFERQRRKRGVKYLRWSNLEVHLCGLAKSRDNRVRFVSQDLLKINSGGNSPGPAVGNGSTFPIRGISRHSLI